MSLTSPINLLVQIAQLAERKTENLEVTSSSLVLDIFYSAIFTIVQVFIQANIYPHG